MLGIENKYLLHDLQHNCVTMADRGPPELQPPRYTTSSTPAPPVQPPVPTTQPIQPAPMPQLNWSYFKPEFAGKPDKDAEAHLRTNDLMGTHAFLEGVKVQRFCLTLVGEARLWYESLRPIAVGWNGLCDQFRQQYSKIGNTREQLFHAWRSFHHDENTHVRHLCYMY